MAEASCNEGDEDHASNRVGRPKKSRRTKRILVALDFLKNISLDGKSTVPASRERAGEIQAELGPGPKTKSRQVSVDEERLISLLPATTKVTLHHCVSVASSANVEEDLRSQRRSERTFVIDEHFPIADSSKVSKSKSFITTSSEASEDRRILKENSKVNLMDSRFFLGRSVRSFVDRRTVLVSRSAVPFRLMSVLPYRKDDRVGQLAKETNNTITIEGVEKAEGDKVLSYCHLLVPATFNKRTISEHHEQAEETTTHLAREQNDVINDATYDPMLLDDPELTSGKHRTVLKLKSFMVSVIQYAKPSEIKKDINERFKEKFPNTNITLTKLRSIKADMLEIGIKCGLEKATIACSHVYFEKLVMKEKINKVNRKYCAGACLVLAAKFMEDIKKGSVSLIIEAIMDKFRLHLRDLLSCELLVLIALEFSLCLPAEEVNPMFRRLEGSRLVNSNAVQHIKSD